MYRVIGRAVIVVGILVIVFITGMLVGRHHRNATGTQVVVRVDTLVRHDTITRERPVYRFSKVIRYDTVTRYVTLRDTAFVTVPIESKVYEEDSVYRAVVSGYRASLDTLFLFPKTTTITIRETVTRTEPKSHWAIGVTIGPSMLLTPKGDVYGGLGGTLGFSYNF